MNINIDDIYTVVINGQSHEGYGVGRINDFTVFVPGAIKDEEVLIKINRVQKSFCYGELLEIKKQSVNRTVPICPIFDECGGCEIMHFKYDYQLAFKKQMVVDTLERLGGLYNLNVNDVVGMNEPYYYRNKVQVPFANKNDEVICGFYKKRTHEIIPFEECFIQNDVSTEIVKSVRDLANKYHISAYNEVTHTGILKHVMTRNNSRDEFMVVIVTNSNQLPYEDEIVGELRSKFKNIISIIHNINKKQTNVVLGAKSRVLYGIDLIVEEISGLKFIVNHKSFLQVNHIQTEKMYKKVIDLLKPDETKTYVDAYCGVGTMGLLVARHSKHVYGIEIVEDAIKNANSNAKVNNISNVTFIVGKTEEELPKLDINVIDGIIIDPPRKGCDQSLLETLIKSNINRIVYVSCNVATLARDLKILNEYYQIKEVIPFDLFSQTAHVETITLLERR